MRCWNLVTHNFAIPSSPSSLSYRRVVEETVHLDHRQRKDYHHHHHHPSVNDDDKDDSLDNDDNDHSKFIRVLLWLIFWKKTNRQARRRRRSILLGEDSMSVDDNTPPVPASLIDITTTTLFSANQQDDALALELQQKQQRQQQQLHILQSIMLQEGIYSGNSNNNKYSGRPTSPPLSDYAASIPEEFLRALQTEDEFASPVKSSANTRSATTLDQNIFVNKEVNLPLWKRILGSFLFLRCVRQQRKGPLARQEDSNSTTESTHDESPTSTAAAATVRAWESDALYPSHSACTAHFSVSSHHHGGGKVPLPAAPISTSSASLSPRGRIPRVLLSGTEAIEMEWKHPGWWEPGTTGADIAATLQQYLEQQQQHHDQTPNHHTRSTMTTTTVADFDQVHPSDSKSVGDAKLAVSFDNKDACAQLIFTTEPVTTTSRSEDSEDFLWKENNKNKNFGDDDDDDPIEALGAQYPFPLKPTIPSVERRQSTFVSQSCRTPFFWTDDTIDGAWSELEDEEADAFAFVNQVPSVEVSLTDYENHAAWSYDDAASFSSILSASHLFRPIYRGEDEEETSSHHNEHYRSSSLAALDPLFVPPCYYTGCFTHGPTLLNQVHGEDSSCSSSSPECVFDEDDDGYDVSPHKAAGRDTPSYLSSTKSPRVSLYK